MTSIGELPVQARNTYQLPGIVFLRLLAKINLSVPSHKGLHQTERWSVANHLEGFSDRAAEIRHGGQWQNALLLHRSRTPWIRQRSFRSEVFMPRT